MNLQQRYHLTSVINARGTFTPLGVSRSSTRVRQAVSEALGEFLVLDELQQAASDSIARMSGAEAGAVTHCVAAAITLSVAATMTGGHAAAVSQLPDSSGMRNRVVMPANHAVDYGHPIVTDVRLAGAVPVLAGSRSGCTLHEIEAALSHERTACLLLVSSRLVAGESPDLRLAVAAAQRRGLPAIIDAAAQDMRIGSLLDSGADLVLVSGHKYLASPTAGLIIGRRPLVQACRAQERGIGRAMKPTKEAIVGVLAALEERGELDIAAWSARQEDKVRAFAARVNRIRGLDATVVPDPTGMPFSRACITVEEGPDGTWNAALLAERLAAGSPSIRVMDQSTGEGKLFLELVPLAEAEVELIIERIAELVPGED
jgi:L-seryl-tRNA(Ser) seleniumtransferase